MIKKYIDMMRKRNIIILLLLLLFFSPIYVRIVFPKDVKRLYFEEKNEEVVWNKIKGDHERWFVNLNQMIPGEIYMDQIEIKNGSKKSYKLYLKPILIEHMDMQEALLRRIHIKVEKNKVKVYDGNAIGISGTENYQNIIPAGIYKPSELSVIQLVLKLDQSIGIEYCDVLKHVEWKFLVREITENQTEEAIVEVYEPETWDSSRFESLLYIMIVIAGVLLVTNIFKQKME